MTLAPAQAPVGLAASRRRKASGRARAHCNVSLAGDRPGGARLPSATNDPAGTTLQLLERARRDMGLPEPAAATAAETDPPSPLSIVRRTAARCWALLLVRIYECLPLRCPKCGEPMRIIAFVLERPVIERILEHIGVIGGRARLPTVKARLPPVGHRPTADAATHRVAGALAAATRVRFRPGIRDGGMAGDGPDGGAGGRLGVTPRHWDRWRAAVKAAALEGGVCALGRDQAFGKGEFRVRTRPRGGHLA